MKFWMFSILLFLFSFAGISSNPAENPFLYGQQNLKADNSIELKIYPNPVETGRVTLEMRSGEINEIRLIDIAGKDVIVRKTDFGTSKYQLQLSNVPSGIYFVRIKTAENQVVVKKLVVTSR